MTVFMMLMYTLGDPCKEEILQKLGKIHFTWFSGKKINLNCS